MISFSDQPEISKLTPPLQYVPIGLPADVRCDVDASPPASDVTWTKNGRYINFDEDDRIAIKENGTRLSIEPVYILSLTLACYPRYISVLKGHPQRV